MDVAMRIEQFRKFYQALTRDSPIAYTPWLFPLNHNSKDPDSAAIEAKAGNKSSCCNAEWKKIETHNNKTGKIKVHYECEKCGTSKTSWTAPHALLTYEQAITRITNGGNIGIAARDNDWLHISDSDSEKNGFEFKGIMCRSRTRFGRHYFNWMRPADKQNIPTSKDGEVRAVNQYVVAAGSYVPVSKHDLEKKVEEDSLDADRLQLILADEKLGLYSYEGGAPEYITPEELPEVFKKQVNKEIDARKSKDEAELRKSLVGKEGHEGGRKGTALFDLTINDVAPSETGRTSHPLHDSDTGTNWMISNGLGHCWRHAVSLNAYQYLAVELELAECQDAGTRHKGGECGISGDKNILFRVWVEAKKRRLIPDNDPVPYSCLLHIMGKNKGTLNMSEFNSAIEHVEREVPSGRTRQTFQIAGLHSDDESTTEISEEERIRRLQQESLELLASQKKDDSTEYLVAAILTKWRIVTIKEDKGDDEMYIYRDGIYEPNAKSDIRQFIRETYGKAHNKALVSAVIEKIASNRTFVKAEDFFDSAPIHLIPVQNGIIDLRANTLIPFTPDIYFQTKLPVTFEPKADCQSVKTFYKEVLRNEADVDVVQEFFGYCLQRNYNYPVIFMCLGSGSNGKSRHLELIRAFLGTKNVTSVTLQDIERDQYSKAELFGKLANIAGDISKKPIEDSGELKAITGGDLVKANRKHLTQITFVNYAKLVFSANELPPTYDTTEGFFRRWKILDFPHKFYKQVDYDALSESEKKDAKLADPDIIAKLSTPEEMSGLLNWALDGLVRLNRRKDFSNSKTIAQVEKQWYRRSNSFYAFLEEHIQYQQGKKIVKTELRRVFADFCNEHKLDPVSDKVIAITLEKFGVLSRQIRLPAEHPLADGDFNHREFIWDGMRWKNEEPSSNLVSSLSVYKPKDKDPFKPEGQTVLKDIEKTSNSLSGVVITSGGISFSSHEAKSSQQLSKTLDAMTGGSNPMTQASEPDTKQAFLIKVLRLMYAKTKASVSFEDLFAQVKVYAQTPTSSPFSSDNLEKEVEKTLEYMLNKTKEIMETPPGRYMPI